VAFPRFLTDVEMNNLHIPECEIRRHGPGHVLAVCWRQWRTERALYRRGVHFRSTDLSAVAAAYAAMSDREFEAINGRQDWANWRTIPRALNGNVPDRALRVLDLGCGTGSSTQVLAFYCPAGSHITGYELVEPLLANARRRTYRHRHGSPVRVDFCCQGLTEALRGSDGSLIKERSVDLVNASGVIGHHLNAVSIQPLLHELGRILVDEGIAMLDVGPSLPAEALIAVLGVAGFRCLGNFRSCWLDRTGQVVFRANVH
jgi:SAM-dependent methyltransferase